MKNKILLILIAALTYGCCGDVSFVGFSNNEYKKNFKDENVIGTRADYGVSYNNFYIVTKEGDVFKNIEVPESVCDYYRKKLAEDNYKIK